MLENPEQAFATMDVSQGTMKAIKPKKEKLSRGGGGGFGSK
jgi:hypothetical protein